MVSEEPQLFSISGFFTQYGTACHVFVMYASYFFPDLSMDYSDVIAMACIVILLTRQLNRFVKFRPYSRTSINTYAEPVFSLSHAVAEEPDCD